MSNLANVAVGLIVVGLLLVRQPGPAATRDTPAAAPARSPVVHSPVRTGWLVRVTWNPRSRRLVSLAVIESPRRSRH